MSSSHVPKPPVTGNEKSNVAPPLYSEFSNGRRRLVLAIVAVAGFLGPLAAGVYLPALPILMKDFDTSESTINATVSVYMITLAVAVSSRPPFSVLLEAIKLTATAIVLGVQGRLCRKKATIHGVALHLNGR